MSNPNDGPLPSSANLLQQAASNSEPKNNSLPSARSLGLEFPWHAGGNKKSTLPPITHGMNRLPSSNNNHLAFQQLPPSSSLPGASSLSLPQNNQISKTFQNTPLQGLRTGNLGKRYMEDLPQYLPQQKIPKLEKSSMPPKQYKPQSSNHQHQQSLQHHQQQLQLLHQQQQHQAQQHQRKVDEVEVTGTSFVCRFMDLPGVITLQKLPGCVKLDNQTISCTSLQQQIEMTRQFILEYDRLKHGKYQAAR